MGFEDNIIKILNEEFKNRTSEDSKYTELQFSKDLGIGKDAMHTYLKGKRIPNADSLVRIAKGLNVSIDYLCGLSNIKKIEPSEDDKAITRASELTGLSIDSLNVMHQRKEINNLYKNYADHISDTDLEIAWYANKEKFDLSFLSEGQFRMLSDLIVSKKFKKIMDSLSRYFFFTEQDYKDSDFNLYVSQFDEESMSYGKKKASFEINYSIVNDILAKQIIDILESEKQSYQQERILEKQDLKQYIKELDENTENELDSMFKEHIEEYEEYEKYRKEQEYRNTLSSSDEEIEE